jgi:hyperosmotically inducible protein
VNPLELERRSYMRSFAGIVSAVSLVFTVACAQTDAGITTNVKSKLAADDTVKAYQVDVDTNNHVVTLKGDVNSPLAKERAVEIARNTDGVTDVIDQIRVSDTAATSGRLDDDDVAIRVDDDVKVDAERAGEKTKAGAEKAADKTVDTTKKIGDKTADAARKAGSKVKDVFTDDNKDSDHDGK